MVFIIIDKIEILQRCTKTTSACDIRVTKKDKKKGRISPLTLHLTSSLSSFLRLAAVCYSSRAAMLTHASKRCLQSRHHHCKNP
ncbi:hypothetical protein E2C01_088313 [Portunus trituberculatus]|uniref:Uncharacterized protein n=1 Tax=Portunus trituberculatus TaxID=210409 RepID=A0A5B7J5T4_PORTR|nr:hypothetical protein [Portunus trituberculatus]